MNAGDEPRATGDGEERPLGVYRGREEISDQYGLLWRVTVVDGRAAVIRLREVSRDDLLAMRQEILDGLGCTYPELAERAKAYSLVGDEWSAWDDLREIDFLLGDDDTPR